MEAMSKRIIVIGAAGSGKSVMARRLAVQLDLAYIARDEILGSGQGSAEHRQAADRATSRGGWVFDGTPFEVEDLVYARANMVVFLDYSRMTVTWRSWRRAVRVLASGRADGPHKPENPWKWLDPAHPVRWSWSSQPRRRAQLRAVLKSSAVAHAERQHFSKPRDARRWLRTIVPVGSEIMDVRVVVVCAECQVHWYADDELAKCATPEHSHRQVEIHRHRSVVVLPDGTSIVAVSFNADDPYTRDRSPDFGLYLDDRWQPPWPHDHLDWPDFGVPGSATPVIAALRSVLDRARAGERVEVGCLGGHGRTGTALACLAILTGQSAASAVDWVRTVYCASAVETPEQEAFVAHFRG